MCTEAMKKNTKEFFKNIRDAFRTNKKGHRKGLRRREGTRRRA